MESQFKKEIYFVFQEILYKALETRQRFSGIAVKRFLGYRKVYKPVFLCGNRFELLSSFRPKTKLITKHNDIR